MRISTIDATILEYISVLFQQPEKVGGWVSHDWSLRAAEAPSEPIKSESGPRPPLNGDRASQKDIGNSEALPRGQEIRNMDGLAWTLDTRLWVCISCDIPGIPACHFWLTQKRLDCG
jgi:hypothetical protein